MNQLIKNLKNNGVREKYLREDESLVISQLLKLGIVFKFYKSGDIAYKFSNNVNISKSNNGYSFEVVPNRHMGVVFDYEDVFECVSEDKQAPDFYCLTYKLNPTEEDVKKFHLGEDVRVKILARGYDIGNEGLSVKLPRREELYFSMEKAPYITIGLAEGAKSKHTASLKFDEPVNGVFIEGRKALIVKGKIYYNINDIDVVSDIFILDNEKCEVKKQSEKKLIKGR